MSLKRLEVDYIDVYLIHWPDENVPYEESFAAMDECVKSGKVRFVGVSNFTVEQMEQCMKARPIDVIQVGYHLFDRRMEKEIFPFCAKNDIGVMGYGSLAHGLLTGTFSADMAFDSMDWRGGGIFFGQPLLKGQNLGTNVDVVNRIKAEIADPRGVPLTQIALAWSLRNPVVSTALVGSRTPQELASNLAGTELKLSDDEVARIEEIMKGAAGMHDVFTPLRQAMEEWGPIAEAQPGNVGRPHPQARCAARISAAMSSGGRYLRGRAPTSSPARRGGARLPPPSQGMMLGWGSFRRRRRAAPCAAPPGPAARQARTAC